MGGEHYSRLVSCVKCGKGLRIDEKMCLSCGARQPKRE